MKKLSLLLNLTGILLISCTSNMNKMKSEENPFFSAYETPYETPNFIEINTEDYLPAFKEGIRQHQEEIDTIVQDPETPDFDNTLAAMDISGLLLIKVSNVFYNLTSANTSEELQQIAKEVAPLISQHRDDIRLNAHLFKRVKAVYDQKDELNLTTEQEYLLDKIYKDFVRGGANLSKADQDKLRSINKELSLLSLQFDDNILAENNAFSMVLDNKEDLAGLPQFVRDAGAMTAIEAGQKGKWVFTIHKPSLIPFLQYSDRRDLREKMFLAYINRGNHNNEYDNKEIAAKMASLRVKKANLLGYETHAAYILEENMAKTPDKVYELLDNIWEAALPMSKKEVIELQAMIDSEGKKFTLQPWDWWYYAEKLRKAKYDLSDEMLKPYFELENVRKGMFDVAFKLYGLQFTERKDIPKYHEDVIVFEVKEADGSHIGILYQDFFPRASKSGGAWMNSYRKQYKIDGENVSPIITMVMNFTKPTAEQPSLLTFEEVSTMFHEFGHALHGLLSDCNYRTLSGTSVPRDFVELPSQIMENWAADPNVLRSFAKHYETGETIPDELLGKLENSRYFNQGFVTVEYTAAAYLDMDWHTITSSEEQNTMLFEDEAMKEIGLIPEIVVRYRSPYFAHIFAGGYSSGYYSYIWAEVLDADAFEAFKETSLFDQKTAKAFRENILERGGTDDPMTLYKNFRGTEPSIKPMLKRKGLN